MPNNWNWQNKRRAGNGHVLGTGDLEMAHGWCLLGECLNDASFLGPVYTYTRAFAGGLFMFYIMIAFNDSPCQDTYDRHVREYCNQRIAGVN
jgi:hypothetical protein